MSLPPPSTQSLIKSSPPTRLSSSLTPAEDQLPQPLLDHPTSQPNPASSSSSFTTSCPSFYHKPTQPSQSWETAYVFAFIYKFTSLCQDLKTGLKLRNAVDLERALASDTRVSIDHEDDDQQDSSNYSSSDSKEILSNILSTFHENLRQINTSTWEKWLKGYVEEIVKRESKNPNLFGILKWEENYLRSRKNGIWDLDWTEKVHLLRVLVDHQLTYSPKIRSQIDDNYEKALLKPSKQSSSTTINHIDHLNHGTSSNSKSVASAPPTDSKPFQNPLLIKPLGLDRHVKTYWQIDDSPRIYSSGNPYKSNCTWDVLSSTRADFIALQSTLATDPTEPLCPSPSSSGEQDPTGPARKVKIPAMFTAAARKKAAGALKKVEQGVRFEWLLSKALEEVAKPKIDLGEQRVQLLVQEKNRLEELEAKRQRRLALATAPRQPGLTRATPGFGVRSRLRSQVSKPDYAIDSADVDRQFEKKLREYERGEIDERSMVTSTRSRPAKRKQHGRRHGSSQSSAAETDEEGWKEPSLVGEEEEEEGAGEARPSRKRQRDSKKSVPQAQAQGERRSSRVRTKAEPEVEAEEELRPAVEEPVSAAAWSRSPAPGSPSTSEPPDGPSEPVDMNGNVSVWSRGKLIYVAGNNKYASKAVGCGPKKKIIAKAGSGVVLKTQAGAGQQASRSTDPSTLSSLATLQARLASMGDEDDDDEDEAVGNGGPEEKEDVKQGGDEVRSGLSSIFDDLNHHQSHHTRSLSSSSQQQQQSTKKIEKLRDPDDDVNVLVVAAEIDETTTTANSLSAAIEPGKMIISDQS